jgi:hypothetical protein
MKRIITLGLLLMSTTFVKAQINAVTESGEEVFLYDNGTWKYADEKDDAEAEIKLNDKPFTKDKNSTFVVKSKKANIGIWINPKDWSFTKSASNEDAEFQFQKKGEDLYAMLIAEKIEIPLEALKNIALQNAKTASTDIKVVNEEYRNVNGIKVLMMHMAGTVQGMKIVYCGYYYSNDSGTIQLLTYTSENLLKNYHDDIETFLNGLVKLE